MGEQKEEDLYHNFSRKDLQGLCKKYGLPANKSNSEMATSLILYLEKKNLSSRTIWEGTRNDLFASEMKELQAGVKMNSTDDLRKASHRGSGNRRPNNHRDAQQNDMLKCKGSASSDKASEDVGYLTQLHRECNSGAGIQENTFSSVVSSSAMAPSPTFTYNVYCEDGIQLYVDLNSSPSYWIENLKAGVHVCHHVHKPISQSFHQDIGILCYSKEKDDSVIMDPSKEADNGQLEVGSHPANVVADILAKTDEPDGSKYLSHAFNSLDNSKEEQAILSSKIESVTQGKLPGIESSRREESLAADSGANVMVQTGIFCDSKGNSMPSDPKCSGFPGHPGASTSYGLYEKPSLQQTNGSLNDVKCSELSTTVCTEMQTSTCATLSHDIEYSPDEEQKTDAVLYSCCNGGGPLDLVFPNKNGGDIFNPTELNEDNIHGILSAADVGNLDTKNPSDGNEELKSLNYKDQLQIPYEITSVSESNGELKKKRHNDIESQAKFVNAEAKILRSSKHFVGDTNSKRRRSSRLFTK